MQLPLEIEFRNLDRSEAIEADIRHQAEKLEKVIDRITSCHVVFDSPGHNHRKGNLYHVKIVLGVPRKQLVVDRTPTADHSHEDPHVAVRDSFLAMRRMLDEYVHELKGGA